MTNSKHTKDQYNQNSQLYHDGIKGGRWYKYIEKPAMIKLLKEEVVGKKVLDLGCGSGVFVKKIYSLGAKKVIGSDLSSGLIKIAREQNPDIDFYVEDARKTHFKNNEFNVVNSSLVPHYFKNLSPLFNEVNRILKKNGAYVFSMHHPIMEVTHRLEANNKKSKKLVFEPYFHNDLYEWKLREKMNMISYHHTFENIFSSLKKSGFKVDDLVEPIAIKKMEKLDKEFYDRIKKRPCFLIIKARKVK